MTFSDSIQSRTQSDQNPYASPVTVQSPEPPSSTPSNHGLMARAIFGLWAGVLFGGTFGAGGSVLLGITASVPLGLFGTEISSVEQFLLTEIVAAIAGAICGLFAGGIIGPFVSLLSFVGHANQSKWVMGLAMSLSMVAGGAVGMLATHSAVLAGQGDTSLLAAGLGLLIGASSGVLGGFQLGRGILDFIDGKLPA